MTVMAILSLMALEVSHLHNDVSFEDIPIAKRRYDRALVPLAIRAVNNAEVGIRAAHGAGRHSQEA